MRLCNSTENICSYLKSDQFIYPVARIYGSGNQKREMGGFLLINLPNNTFTEFLVGSHNFELCCLEVLLAKGGILPPRDLTVVPLNWKLRLQPSHFVLLMTLNQYVKKRASILVEVIDPNYLGEIGLLLNNVE